MSALEEAYRVLEISPGASDEEVRRAWRELTKVWHPDRFGSDPALRRRAEEKQKALNEAYATVCAAREHWTPPPENAESATPDGWAVRVGGRVLPADSLASILQWVADGRLGGSEELYDPRSGEWVPLNDLPEVRQILIHREAARKRNWAFAIAAFALLLLFRRPTFGMLLLSGTLLAVAVFLLLSWARTIDRKEAD